MGECICTNCRNLKRVISEDGEEEIYECEFGYPSDTCENCCDDDCSLTCSHFCEDNGEYESVIVTCKGCGKEIRKMYQDENEGDVFCPDCYLNNN